MHTVSRTSVKIQDCCTAALVAKTHDWSKVDKVVVGAIYGKAVDLVTRANPSGGDPYVGFAGQFEITPAITDKDKGGSDETVRSSVMFVPDAFRDVLRTALDKVLYPDPNKPDRKARGVSVTFAAKVLLVKAENKDGYAWGLEIVEAPTADDPLTDMRTRLFPTKGEEVAKSADAPAAGNGKKK